MKQRYDFQWRNKLWLREALTINSSDAAKLKFQKIEYKCALYRALMSFCEIIWNEVYETLDRRHYQEFQWRNKLWLREYQIKIGRDDKVSVC